MTPTPLPLRVQCIFPPEFSRHCCNIHHSWCQWPIFRLHLVRQIPTPSYKTSLQLPLTFFPQPPDRNQNDQPHERLYNALTSSFLASWGNIQYNCKKYHHNGNSSFFITHYRNLRNLVGFISQAPVLCFAISTRNLWRWQLLLGIKSGPATCYEDS